jgi:predicted O-methyltransferase YrrM
MTLLGMFYTNNFPLFKEAINSVKERCDIYVLDNSKNNDLYEGVDGVTFVFTPTVPLSFTQSQNWLRRLAIVRKEKYYLYMHSDGKVESHLKEFIDYVEKCPSNWGAIFTFYDILAAFNTTAVKIVGEWDTNFPHYFSDVDYYTRIKRAGFECIGTEFGAYVKHQLPSATIHTDPFYEWDVRHIQGYVDSLFSEKWGNCANPEKKYPYDDNQIRQVLRFFHQDPTFQKLAALFNDGEGNTLDVVSEQVSIAQTTFILKILDLVRPGVIVETGTNKGMFGFLISHFVRRGTVLYTFDIKPISATAAGILEMETPLKVHFYLGDSQITFTQFSGFVDLVFVDGFHAYSHSKADILNAVRCGAKYIIVDDTNVEGPRQACEETAGYHIVRNLREAEDDRKMVLLVRDDVLPKSILSI